MPEDNQNRNFDTFLEDKIKNSLGDHTSMNFTDELMKRVQIAEEFEKEDVKTFKIAKFVIGGLVSLLIAFIMVSTFFINSNQESNDAGFFSNLIDSFSNNIEMISLFTAENLGFAFDFQTGVVILLSMACIVVFSLADKLFIKKRIKL